MSDETPTEHDLRQYERMETQMRHFAEGKLNLGELIGDLEFLFCALERVNPAWEMEFRKNCIELEIVHAMLLSEREQARLAVMGKSDRETVSEAIDAIKELIQKRRAAYPKASSNEGED